MIRIPSAGAMAMFRCYRRGVEIADAADRHWMTVSGPGSIVANGQGIASYRQIKPLICPTGQNTPIECIGEFRRLSNPHFAFRFPEKGPATEQGIARRVQALSRRLYTPIPVWAGLERSYMR